jgi:hypothetical protein
MGTSAAGASRMPIPHAHAIHTIPSGSIPRVPPPPDQDGVYTMKTA